MAISRYLSFPVMLLAQTGIMSKKTVIQSPRLVDAKGGSPAPAAVCTLPNRRLPASYQAG